MAEMKNVLRVEHVTMQFGGVVAVDDLSMEVNEGEIVALIGPNGAGKTTAFNVITGVYAPTNGRVLFNGKRVVENHPKGKLRRQYKGKHMGEYKAVLEPTPDKLTKMGMARTFQNIRLWKSMTVFDNVLIAKHLRRSSNMFTAMFRLNAREEARQRAEVLALLREYGVHEVHLLPFHQFGQNKYTQLGIPYEMETVKQLHPEVLGNYQKIFLDEGLNCTFH